MALIKQHFSGPRDFRISKQSPSSGSQASPLFKITPDGKKIVYVSDEDSAGTFHLYVSDLNGDNKIKLSSNPYPYSPSTKVLEDISFTQNSTTVFTTPTPHGLSVTDSVMIFNQEGKLYSSSTLSKSWNSFLVATVINSTSFTANDSGNPVGATLAGTTKRLLSGNSEIKQSFCISPDSQKVLFHQLESTYKNVYCATLDGSNLYQLTTTSPVISGNDKLLFSPDSTKVAYCENVSGTSQLKMSNIDGSSKVSLNSFTPYPSGSNNSLQFYVTSNRVFFAARATSPHATNWYLVGMDYDGSNVKIYTLLVNASSRTLQQDSWLLSPDESYLVSLSTQANALRRELYSTPTSGDYTNEVKISGTIQPNGNVQGFSGPSFGITPDSSKVVFVGDMVTDSIQEIFSVDITGGTVYRLCGSVTTVGRNLREFKIISNTEIIYRFNEDSTDNFEIYKATINSGNSKVKILDGNYYSMRAQDGIVLGLDFDGNVYCYDGFTKHKVTPNGTNSFPIEEIITPFDIINGKPAFLIENGGKYDLVKSATDGGGVSRISTITFSGSAQMNRGGNDTYNERPTLNYVRDMKDQYIAYRVKEGSEILLYVSLL